MTTTHGTTSDDALPVLDPVSELALRHELASLIHSRLRTRALLVQSAAQESGASTRVLALVRRLVNEIEVARREALGDPYTDDLQSVLEHHVDGFEGDPCITLTDVPHLDLSPVDHDIAVTVLLDLVTNADSAGATAVDVTATLDDDVLSLTVTDDGSGLDHEPWRGGDPGTSTAILDSMLRRRGGGLHLLPAPARGTAIRARWTLAAGR